MTSPELPKQSAQDDPPAGPAGFAKFLQPRFLLILWLWIGGAYLAFILLSSMFKPSYDDTPDRLVGEMADFEKAFPPRKATDAPFMDGEEMRFIADFKGKVVLVNLWASWCAPCLEELPSLAQLQEIIGTEDFVVLPVALDRKSPEFLRDLLKRAGAESLPLYRDPQMTFGSTYGSVEFLPLTIIYDKKGVEVGRLEGEAKWDAPEAQDLIHAIVRGEKL